MSYLKSLRYILLKAVGKLFLRIFCGSRAIYFWISHQFECTFANLTIRLPLVKHILTDVIRQLDLLFYRLCNYPKLCVPLTSSHKQSAFSLSLSTWDIEYEKVDPVQYLFVQIQRKQKQILRCCLQINRAKYMNIHIQSNQLCCT